MLSKKKQSSKLLDKNENLNFKVNDPMIKKKEYQNN